MSPRICDIERLRAAIERGEVFVKQEKLPAFDQWKHSDAADALRYAIGMDLARRERWKCGVLFRWGSAWIGAHWSPTNKRLCVNFLPFVTMWVCPPGGVAP